MTMYRAQVIDSQLLALSTYGTVTSQPIATFTTDIADRLVNLEVAITATGGGGTPTTPIAINGFSQAVVNACGKNLLNTSATSTTISSVTFTINSDKSVSLSGVASDNIWFLLDSNWQTYGKLLEHGIKANVRLTGCPSTGSSNTYFLALRSGTTTNKVDSGNGVTIPYTPEDTYYPAIYIKSGVDVSGVKFYPMIRYLTIDDGTYEPFNGTTETIPFGQTVYGGRLNVGSGVLTVTHGYVDLSTLSWTYRPSGSDVAPYFYALISDMKYQGTPASTVYDFLCSCYPIVKRTVSDFVDKTITVDGTTTVITQLQIKNSDYTDAPTFATSLSGQYICYEMITPTTIQLNSKQIQAVIGTNNIYADTGDIIDLKFILSVGQAIS